MRVYSFWRNTERVLHNMYAMWDSRGKQCQIYKLGKARNNDCDVTSVKPWPTHKEYCPRCHERLLNEVRPYILRRNAKTGEFVYDYNGPLRWKCWISPYTIKQTEVTKYKRRINYERLRKLFPNWEPKQVALTLKSRIAAYIINIYSIYISIYYQLNRSSLFFFLARLRAEF